MPQPEIVEREQRLTPAQQKSIDYWRNHDETATVTDIEAALSDHWSSAYTIAGRAGHSKEFTANVLRYLTAEDRAQQAWQKRSSNHPGRWMWRRP